MEYVSNINFNIPTVYQWNLNNLLIQQWIMQLHQACEIFKLKIFFFWLIFFKKSKRECYFSFKINFIKMLSFLICILFLFYYRGNASRMYVNGTGDACGSHNIFMFFEFFTARAVFLHKIHMILFYKNFNLKIKLLFVYNIFFFVEFWWRVELKRNRVETFIIWS